jgi:hypothetical protein
MEVPPIKDRTGRSIPKYDKRLLAIYNKAII